MGTETLAKDEDVLNKVKRGKPSADCSVIGTWKLQSYVRERLSDGHRHNQFGESPEGYIGYAPDGRMYAIFTCCDRITPVDAVPTDEEAANAEDPVLNIIEQPERRRTLIAPKLVRGGQAVYTFDIYLQGEGETVFFDV